MAQRERKRGSTMKRRMCSDISMTEGLGCSLKSLTTSVQNEFRKPAPAHATSNDFTHPMIETSAAIDLRPLDLSKVSNSNSTCSWGGSAAEVAGNQQVCPFQSGMTGHEWMHGIPYYPYGQEAYLQNYASAQWSYMWPYHQYAHASYLANKPLQWMPLSPGVGGLTFGNLNNKVYPVVPQPLYPNGQPYSIGTGYQYQSSCQSFSATLNDSGSIYSSQHWNQMTSPPQCVPYAYSYSAPQITEPDVIGNLMISGGHSQTNDGMHSTEPGHVQNIIADRSEANTVLGTYPTSTPDSFCSAPPSSKEPTFRMRLTPEDHKSSDSGMKLCSSIAEPVGKGSAATNPRKQTRRKKPDKIDSKTKPGKHCATAVNQEVTSTTSVERSRGNSICFEATDERLRYELRSAQNKTIDKKAKGRRQKNAVASVSSKRKKSRHLKLACAPDSSTFEEASVVPLADGDADQIIVRKMKEWTLNSQEGETVLHRAASLGLSDVVEYCLRIGLVSSPNCVNSSGCTPLHEACSHGHDRVAQILLSQGAGPNKASISGLRPIQIARQHGHEKIVQLLLEFGADLEGQ